MRWIVFVVLMCGTVSRSYGQSDIDPRQRKVVYNVQLGYNRGVGTVKVRDDLSLKNDSYAYGLELGVGLFIRPQMLIGFNAGMMGLHDPDYNLLPLSVDFRYFFQKKLNSPIIGASSGYSLKLNHNFKCGLVSGINFGYRFGNRKVPVTLMMGFDFHQIKDASMVIYDIQTQTFESIRPTLWFKSFSASVGFQF